MENLSLEQQLNIKIFEQRLQQVDRAGLIRIAVDIYKAKIAQEVSFRDLIGQQWGILDSPGGSNE